MKRVCKINKTVLVMMTLAAVAIALKAPAAWSQGVLSRGLERVPGFI